MEGEFSDPVTSVSKGPDGPDLQLDFSVPEIGDDRYPASHHLLQSINQFYMDDFQGINSEQAHALLCAWEYGMAASNLFNKGKNSYARLLYARLIALFIISNLNIVEEVIAWVGSAGAGRTPINSLKYWGDIEKFFETTKLKMLDAGATAGIA